MGTYPEHRRRNAIEMQENNLANGPIFDFCGRLEALGQDVTLYEMSGIKDDFASSMVVNGRQFYSYRYPAYFLRLYVLSQFFGSKSAIQQNISKLPLLLNRSELNRISNM